MKEKIAKAIMSKYGQAMIALVLALLMTLQEISLGNPAMAWSMGVAVSVGFGLAGSAYSYVTGGEWKWKNLLFWIIGGALGIGIAYLI